jgi:TPP-dependent pyruvate/acetoin dehydrogenase alpha subunit
MYLAKGGDLKRMIAELYGKVTGVAKGKGGSMHLVDVPHGVMGTSAVVGTTIPNAVGYAYAVRCRRDSRVVVSFFGDGATEEGAFHESLNFAALKQLPILFICENNRYAIHSSFMSRQRADNLVERVRPYGIWAERIENNDVIQMYERTKVAVEAMRSGQSGPVFFECMTYRWREHVGPKEDFDFGYRDREEARPWIELDQVDRIGKLIPVMLRRRIDAEVEREIDEAFAFAESSPFPEPEELYRDVFSGE